MLAKPHELTPAYIDALIAGAIPEGQEIDYKRTLPDKGEEFCKDVSAFANANGGVMFFGLGEDPMGAPQLNPVTLTLGTWDEKELQLRNWLDSMTEPPIQGVQFVRIAHPAGMVLALHVPPSHGGPHWFGAANKRRFVTRRGNKVDSYTYQELRNDFDRTANAINRAGVWINNRIEALRQNRTFRPVTMGPLVAVHLVPLAPYFQNLPNLRLDATVNGILPRIFQDFSWTMNFEGLAISPSRQSGYTQLFRNGAIEAVHFAGQQNMVNKNFLPGGVIVKHVRTAMQDTPGVWANFGISGAALVSVSLLGIGGFSLAIDGELKTNATPNLTDMITSPYYVDDIGYRDSLKQSGSDALDTIWQGFDVEKCGTA